MNNQIIIRVVNLTGNSVRALSTISRASLFVSTKFSSLFSQPTARNKILSTLRAAQARSAQSMATLGSTRISQKCSVPTKDNIDSHPTAVTPQNPTIHSLYEERTGTWQYVVADPSTLHAVIIDSVLDFDPVMQSIRTQTADALLRLISENNYTIDKILETHAHADHLTAASYLQQQIATQQGHKPPICIGKRIRQVQDLFGKRYGIPIEEYEGAFDELFDDNESFSLGAIDVTVIHLPGHTPDHVGYKIGDNVFCGDSLFHTDIGTARCDFPGGSATSLYESAHKLFQLPEYTKIWTGHDYPPSDRGDPVPYSTVRDHKERNKHISQNVTVDDFVSRRKERDATLAEPKLLNPSLQINICAGRLPRPTPLGHRFLHLPLKVGSLEW